jgi:hypothetical protein
MRGSGRINEEHVCIDSFIQHLREIDDKRAITYCEEPDDPPDFWVIIEGDTYAIEVTSIAKDYGYEVLCTKFFKNIRSEFAASNIIKGTYHLSIRNHPRLPKKGTSGWKTLISTITT